MIPYWIIPTYRYAPLYILYLFMLISNHSHSHWVRSLIFPLEIWWKYDGNMLHISYVFPEEICENYGLTYFHRISNYKYDGNMLWRKKKHVSYLPHIFRKNYGGNMFMIFKSYFILEIWNCFCKTYLPCIYHIFQK